MVGMRYQGVANDEIEFTHKLLHSAFPLIMFPGKSLSLQNLFSIYRYFVCEDMPVQLLVVSAHQSMNANFDRTKYSSVARALSSIVRPLPSLIVPRSNLEVLPCYFEPQSFNILGYYRAKTNKFKC